MVCSCNSNSSKKEENEKTEIQNNPINNDVKEDYTSELQQLIKETNQLYPYDLGNGLIMTSLVDEGEYATYYYKINLDDVEEINEDELKQSKIDLQHLLINQSKNDTGNRDILLLFYKNNKGLKYHYYNNTITYDIIFSHSELGDILNQSE